MSSLHNGHLWLNPEDNTLYGRDTNDDEWEAIGVMSRSRFLGVTSAAATASDGTFADLTFDGDAPTIVGADIAIDDDDHATILVAGVYAVSAVFVATGMDEESETQADFYSDTVGGPSWAGPHTYEIGATAYADLTWTGYLPVGALIFEAACTEAITGTASLGATVNIQRVA